ncbi:MAG TPA: non-heme iron oxygenase ferredoxin subunit [Acidimicrobiales bacterium]|jgi:3-phenylpropionate/trans-cinnamate dioxygenase ferredoxin subunit|nr:non-heme iron oxygenase ferredoxin subunit [Acidimicrobiales bacterium]
MPKVTLCPLEELRSGEARRFDVAGHRIAVVRIDDDVYAIGDTCSHQNVSLSEGEVDTDELTLECWKHGSTFSLETGEALILPATKPVPVYDVRVDGGQVVVVVDDDR